MDNASYHSTIQADQKKATSASLKAEIIKWLQGRPDATKPELYNLIKAHKPQPIYKIDSIIREHGHEILRLLPYHCELNPIELIWSQINGYVARQNNFFMLKSVVKLVEDAIAQISTFDWRRACDHTAKIEEEYKKNDGIRPRQPPVHIPKF